MTSVNIKSSMSKKAMKVRMMSTTLKRAAYITMIAGMGSILTASPALADCTSPASPEGGLAYFTVDDTYRLCNGSDVWVTLASGTLVSELDDLTDAITDYATDDNMFIGSGAGGAISGGANNLGIGISALADLTSGDENIAIGYRSLYAATVSSGNIALGNGALTTYNSATSGGMIAIGRNALSNAADGGDTIAIGDGALQNWNQLPANSDNVAVGDQAMVDFSTGAYNVVVGTNAGPNITSGDNNVFIGSGAGVGNAYGMTGVSGNIFIGRSAGSGIESNAAGNIVIGSQSGNSIAKGGGNILIGDKTDVTGVNESEELNIGNILFGDLDTSGDPKIGSYKYCDEDLINCFTAAGVSSGSVFTHSGTLVSPNTGTVAVATDDFVFGSTTLDSSGAQMNRFFFDKSKGAFRAGHTSDGTGGITTFWDDASVGNYSFASGSASVASGSGSFAHGHMSGEGSVARASGNGSIAFGHTQNEATGEIQSSGDASLAIGFVANNTSSNVVSSGITSFAMGRNLTASGDYSLAFGRDNTATSEGSIAIGRRISSTGERSIALGLNSQNHTTAPIVSGARSVGIFMDGGVLDSVSGMDMTVNDTFGIIGGDFVVGSYQLDDTGSGNEDFRMFFDRSQGALRAGSADGAQWDTASIGLGSVGLGRNAIASGEGSVALGQATAATGGFSAAIGPSNIAGNSYAFAIGGANNVTGVGGFAMGGINSVGGTYGMAYGFSTTASSDYSLTLGSEVHTRTGSHNMAIGLADQTDSNANRPAVVGASSLGVFMTAAPSYTLTQANTLGLIGGQILFDQDPSVDGIGCIAFDDATDSLQMSNDCTTFYDIASSDSVVFELNGSVVRNSGDVTTEDFVFGSTQLADTGTIGHDKRFFFDKSKGAFRAGNVVSTQWDDANVAVDSVAMGYNTTASGGQAGVALGYTTTASGGSGNVAIGYQASATANFIGFGGSVALGLNSTASNYAATAIGSGQASSYFGIAMGNQAVAQTGNYSMALGHSVISSGEHSLALGLGSSTPTHPTVSGANSMGIFSGDQTGVDISANNVVAIMGADLGVGVSPSGVIHGLNTTDRDMPFRFISNNILTARKIVMEVEDKDTGGGSQDESAALRVNKSGAFNVADDGSAVLDLTYSGGVHSNDRLFYAVGRLADGGAVTWGIDTNDADIWTTGSLMAGATGTDCGGTAAACFNSPSVVFDVAGGDSYINTGANLGIGMTGPSVALDVTGDIEYTGTITDVSDIRLKKDVKPLADRGSMMQKLDEINTYSFVMKDDVEEQVEFGVIAQEIDKVFPELIRIADPENGYMSVNYIGLIAPMIEATKELKAENDALKNKVAALESNHASVGQDIESLKKQVKLLNRAAGQNVEEASLSAYWLLFLGFIGGAGLAYAGRRRNTPSTQHNG